MKTPQNADPVARLHRLYHLKLTQLEQAARAEGSASLRCRVLAAEAEAIDAALRRRTDQPIP